MNGRRVTRGLAVIVPCCLLFLFIHCTQPAVRGRRGEGDDRGTAVPGGAGTSGARSGETAVPPVYDLEDEMEPESTPLDSVELVDEVAPLPRDTVSVEEVVPAERPGERYDLGYRVQIFASSELAKAESVRDAARSGTGYPAYIEFEGGLYKVRVGDFATRAEAAQARGTLVALFPDCWIVQTTVRR